MRKIASKHREERKRKRNQVIVGCVLIFVMFFSVISYGFANFTNSDGGTSENQNHITYNGFIFTEQNNFWILNFNGRNFIFSHNPEGVPKISSQVNLLSSYNEKPLFIHSESPIAESEISTNLFGLVERIQNACPENEDCEEDIPTKTCEDNFIIIKEGSQRIKQENNCVFIEGKSEDLIKLTGEFLLSRDQ